MTRVTAGLTLHMKKVPSGATPLGTDIAAPHLKLGTVPNLRCEVLALAAREPGADGHQDGACGGYPGHHHQ